MLVNFFFSFLFFSQGKNVSNCEDIEVCHKFISKIVPFIILFSKTRFIIVDYSVCGQEFVISVNYDKVQFEHLKQEYICKILEELKKSKLYRYCWAVDRPLCEDVELPGNYFLCSVVITNTREQKKYLLYFQFSMNSKRNVK